jgi:O-antigen ligase
MTAYEYLTFQDMLCGYGAFAGGRILSPVIGATIGEASRMTIDNVWLELLVNNGFLGVFMFLAITLYVGVVLLKTIKHGQNETRFLAIECFVVWVVLFIRSFFVSSLMLHSNIPFFVVLGVVLYLRKYKANIPKSKLHTGTKYYV